MIHPRDGALVLLVGASIVQLFTGWGFALVAAAAIWISVFGTQIAQDELAKNEARAAGCPFCAWGKPHNKGAGCT